MMWIKFYRLSWLGSIKEFNLVSLGYLLLRILMRYNSFTHVGLQLDAYLETGLFFSGVFLHKTDYLPDYYAIPVKHFVRYDHTYFPKYSVWEGILSRFNLPSTRVCSGYICSLLGLPVASNPTVLFYNLLIYDLRFWV